jgi:hypothetical protein
MPYKQKYDLNLKIIRKSDSVRFFINAFNKKTGVYLCWNKYYGHVELYENDFIS